MGCDYSQLIGSSLTQIIIINLVVQSVMGQPDTTVFVGFILGLVICQFNNDFGALFRALGLMLILFIRRAVLSKCSPWWC